MAFSDTSIALYAMPADSVYPSKNRKKPSFPLLHLRVIDSNFTDSSYAKTCNCYMPRYRNKEFLKLFGENLKKIRNEKSVSQQEFASVLGFSQSHIANIESGKINTSISHASAMAEALKIPVTRLFELGDY